MALTWKVHQSFENTLFHVAFNGSLTESSATQVKWAAGGSHFVFEGSFTGSPAAGGTVTGFRLYDNGQLVIDASGYDMSFKALLAAIKDLKEDDEVPFFDLLYGGPMTIEGPNTGVRLLGGDFDDRIFGRGGDDTVDARNGNDLVKGGDGNDTLHGGSGKDTLKGGKGDDLLVGGFGKDKLVGGPGDDILAFDPQFLNPFFKNGVDKIVKFKPGQDKIGFFMFGLDAPEGLAKGAFRLGKEAKDKDDRVLYDRDSRTLYYDQDGTGKTKAVKIAKFDSKPDLSHHDFLLIPYG